METLRQRRRLKALSIKDLADRAGVSTRTVVDIELGRVDPRPRTVRRICAALGTEPGDVVEFAVPRRERTGAG